MKSYKKLPVSFYQNEDVLTIAKNLIGKYLFTNIGGMITGGMIIETEAYRGTEDKASHAYSGNPTPRTQAMFEKGGIAYVYLCYGMHHLLNVVTNTKDIPHAVLIRAIKPTHGIDTMLVRRSKKSQGISLTNGPGTVCQALGITKQENGLSFLSDRIWIEDRKISPPYQSLRRIGIDYAEEHAFLPWRFLSV